MKSPWIWIALVALAWTAWTRKLATDARGATGAAPAANEIRVWQTFRTVPPAAEVEARYSGTESEMLATKAAVASLGGTFRYWPLTGVRP